MRPPLPPPGAVPPVTVTCCCCSCRGAPTCRLKQATVMNEPACRPGAAAAVSMSKPGHALFAGGSVEVRHSTGRQGGRGLQASCNPGRYLTHSASKLVSKPGQQPAPADRAHRRCAISAVSIPARHSRLREWCAQLAARPGGVRCSAPCLGSQRLLLTRALHRAVMSGRWRAASGGTDAVHACACVRGGRDAWRTGHGPPPG
jgi:hypothetical protein